LPREIVGHVSRIDQDVEPRKKLPEGLVDRKTAGRILQFTHPKLTKEVRREVLAPVMHPEDARAELFSVTDVEALKHARKERALSPLQTRVLLMQALSAARSAEAQVAELKARLGLEVSFLDRNAAAVVRLYEDLQTPSAEQLQIPWLRHWAGVLGAVDHYYLSLASTVLNTEEPWLPLLNFAADTVARVHRECSDTYENSPAFRDAVQRFQLAQRNLYAVSFLACRARLGMATVKKLFPDGLSAKNQLTRLLQ